MHTGDIGITFKKSGRTICEKVANSASIIVDYHSGAAGLSIVAVSEALSATVPFPRQGICLNWRNANEQAGYVKLLYI